MNSNRPKIAIYIDYSIRTPEFTKAFDMLKSQMFNGQMEQFEIEGDLNIIDYWGTQIKNPEIEAFYLAKFVKVKDYDLRFSTLREYFYNEDHYKKFLDDFSFYLYLEADVVAKKDVDLINLAQKHLFDVYLIDEVENMRKLSSTCFFLSKARIAFKALEFINVRANEQLDESRFVGVWNPKVNKEHENAEDLELFREWLMELEKKVK